MKIVETWDDVRPAVFGDAIRKAIANEVVNHGLTMPVARMAVFNAALSGIADLTTDDSESSLNTKMLAVDFLIRHIVQE